jgi:hypothetical protein
MNAVAPNASRRRFLTSLFSAPDAAAARTGLRPVPGLPAQTNGVLWAIAGNGPDDIFIAGDDGLIFHFDGESWQLEEFPSSLHVHALCSTGNRVFSVGWMGQICVRENGAWKLVQGGGSDAATINQPLFDIEAADDGRLWAVGDNGRITEYSGDQWCEHKSGSNSNLRAVLPLANGCVLAAGLGGTVLEFDGKGWRNVETHTGCPIVSMARLPENQVLAVGGEYSIESNEFAGRLFLYSEGTWSAIATNYPLPRLRRVRCEGDSLLIVADAGQAFRWTGDGVNLLPTRVRYDLHDVISFSGGGALICGDNGAVLQECSLAEGEVPVVDTHNSRWQLISQGETNKTLRTLWAIDDEHFIAAGDGGTVIHIHGRELNLQNTPGNLRIHALWGSSPGNVFAVCDNATILHFDGKNWDTAHRGNRDTALLAITGFGPHDIFAVGDSGYALRYDGLMWREIETGAKQELYGLWGHDSQHLLAVGGGGLVMRWNGERWKQFTAGTDYDLYSVTGSGLNKLFLCGLSGTLVRFEDNAWHREFSGVRSDLHAVAGHTGSYYVVGSNGTILGNSDGTWIPENCGVTNTLQAVAVYGSGVLAVGSGGTVLRRAITN